MGCLCQPSRCLAPPLAAWQRGAGRAPRCRWPRDRATLASPGRRRGEAERWRSTRRSSMYSGSYRSHFGCRRAPSSSGSPLRARPSSTLDPKSASCLGGGGRTCFRQRRSSRNLGRRTRSTRCTTTSSLALTPPERTCRWRTSRAGQTGASRRCVRTASRTSSSAWSPGRSTRETASSSGPASP
jgi:hypothetical protein